MAPHSSTLVWQAAVHGVAKSQIRLSNFTFTFHFHALEKEMAIHSGVLAQGWGSLVGCHLRRRTESDTTEATQQQQQQCIYTESRKVVLKNSFTGQQWRNRHREQAYGHGERGGEGEVHGKSNMEVYATICKLDSQLEFVVQLKKLKQGLCINLDCWDGQGNGKEFQKGGDICIPMADSC